MNIRFTIEEENIIAIYAEDSRERTIDNINSAMPYMDEDMRQLAAAAVNKLQAMTRTAHFPKLSLLSPTMNEP